MHTLIIEINERHCLFSKISFIDIFSFSGCPEITSPLKDTSTMEGNSITLECTVVSSPTPEVTWFKGDQQLFDGVHGIGVVYDKESGKSSLTLEHVCLSDAAIYRCDFVNPLGEASTNAQLNIKSKYR